MSNEQDGNTGTDDQNLNGGQQGGDAGTTSREDELPEWARKELTKVRNEAAGHRTKLRDAEAKLANAKTVEEFEAARAALAEENKKLARELLVERAGRNLPDDLRALLKGDTEEELKAHAAVLAQYAPKEQQTAPPERLGGGLNAGGKNDDFDVKETARLIRLGRL